MPKLSTIHVDFDGRMARLNNKMRDTERRAKGVANRSTRSFEKFSATLVKVTAAVYAVRTAIRAVSSVYGAYLEQAKAEAKVAQGVRQTGMAAGFSAKELNKMASALQEVTGVGDEQILSSVTGQLLTFGSIAGDVFERAQKAVLDIATVTEQDLKSSAIQLGKVLEDPVGQMGALSRSGIIFSESQEKVIKDLVKQGELQKAQRILLEEIEKLYGGQAKAVNEATGGTQNLKAEWGDLQERIGGVTSIFASGMIPMLRGAIGFLEDLLPSMESLTDEYIEQSQKVKALEDRLNPLIGEYDRLQEKSTLNEEEQQKLRTVINDIASELPSAITKWDQYGNAIELNRGKVEDLLAAEKARLKFINREAISDVEDQIAVAQTQIKRLLAQLNQGFEYVIDPVTRELTKQILSPTEIGEKRDAIKGLNEDLKGMRAQLKALSGEDIEIPEPKDRSGNGVVVTSEDAQDSKEFIGMIWAEQQNYFDALEQMYDNYISEYEESELEALQEIADARAERIAEGNEAYLETVEQQKLAELAKMDEVINEAYRLGSVLQGVGNDFLSSLGQALQIALNISEALNKDYESSFGQILGIGASLIPGLGFLGGLFRAEGGPVQSNNPYIVGERGPELFVPSSSGMIVNNATTNNIMNNSNDVIAGKLDALNYNIASAMNGRVPVVIQLDGRTIAKTSESNLNTLQREGVNRENL